jgi:hypothetical protein
MLEDGVRRDERLDDDVVHIPPHSVNVVIVVLEPFVDGGDASEGCKT